MPEALSARAAQSDSSAAQKQSSTSKKKTASQTHSKRKKLPSNAHVVSQAAGARLNHPTAHPAASHHRRRRPLTAHEIARTHRLKSAFVASSQLRPMAQQLSQNRTPAAYTGVSTWAHSHSGEGASAAYLALGHAYLLDKRFGEAEANLREAHQAGEVLADAGATLAGCATPVPNVSSSRRWAGFADAPLVPSFADCESGLTTDDER